MLESPSSAPAGHRERQLERHVAGTGSPPYLPARKHPKSWRFIRRCLNGWQSAAKCQRWRWQVLAVSCNNA